jgi:hypothetical protein
MKEHPRPKKVSKNAQKLLVANTKDWVAPRLGERRPNRARPWSRRPQALRTSNAKPMAETYRS